MTTCGNRMDPAAFLSSLGLGKRPVQIQAEDRFFTQGAAADWIYCLQHGRAKLTVVSQKGKQATILLLSPGDFFGEETLVGIEGVRTATATAVNTCIALKIKREEMIRAIHQEPSFCEEFLSYLLERSMRTQADLVDLLFNSSEKRLARTLLLMADFGKPDEVQALIPPVTQETLAEMIGTTRPRVSYFMNRFRSLGLIEYKDRIQVHKGRLKAVLLDQFAEI
jgi:CRP/FNR family transcriptional regulator, cyclic AMP receptor protein